MNFVQTLSHTSQLVKKHLNSVFDTIPDDIALAQAMRYATKGGKCLRGFLVLESAALFDVPRHQAINAAAAIEAIHAFSLVHDDLPAMDDDDLRRGQPTVHIKWDEATAILAGDALQSLAFELLSAPDIGSAEIRINLIQSLSKAVGVKGMAWGQALDMAAEKTTAPLSINEVIHLQDKKTGALIRWSSEAGAIIAQQDTKPLRSYADALGLAFQITDDIIDIAGDSERAGKRLRKDTEAGKATFVSLLGLEAAQKRAYDLIEEAQSHLAPYGKRAEHLIEAARFVISRDR